MVNSKARATLQAQCSFHTIMPHKPCKLKKKKKVLTGLKNSHRFHFSASKPDCLSVHATSCLYTRIPATYTHISFYFLKESNSFYQGKERKMISCCSTFNIPLRSLKKNHSMALGCCNLFYPTIMIAIWFPAMWKGAREEVQGSTVFHSAYCGCTGGTRLLLISCHSIIFPFGA